MDPCRSQEGDSAEVSGGIDARNYSVLELIRLSWVFVPLDSNGFVGGMIGIRSILEDADSCLIQAD
jgi:hypothetical protein